MQTQAYAVDGPKDKFHPYQIERRNVGDNDILIEIAYAGICHSDIHSVREEWGSAKFPMVPGHEIVGKVTKVGSKVQKFKVGDVAGVGCFVDSCGECDHCKADVEQFCKKGASMTYNSTEQDKKTPTYGGYSTQIVIKENYAIKISEKLNKLEGVAPLLCAGITLYHPLNKHKAHVGKGKKVGIVGLGGLGHMGVKFAAAMGSEVTVFSTSPSKEEDAKKLGAHTFVVSKDEEAMKKIAGQYDLIIDTVAAKHPIAPYLSALKVDGIFHVVGAPPEPYEVSAFSLLAGNKSISGSMIGGIKETQEMIDYCAEHGIYADVEVINADQIDAAYDRVVKSDVKYRFSIDVNSIRNQKKE